MSQLIMRKQGSFLVLILFFVCILFSSGVIAQANYSIKGTVKDQQSEPMIGVNIELKNTNIGTITDIDGNYEFKGQISPGTYTIIFSYIGYANRNEKVTFEIGNNDKMINIDLSPDVLAFDEVLVTGSSLGSPKRQLGNAITSLKAADLAKSGTGNALTSLQGRVPGAKITQVSGDPAGGMNISLRGVNSISGGSDPLYVIDGVIVSNSSSPVTQTGNSVGNDADVGTPRMADINPNDIETINVINGAAAAAIYGSRASNGVVLITTKRGIDGKPQISIGTSFSVNQLRKKVAISTYGKQFGYESLRLGNISGVSAAQIAANPGTTTVTVVRDGASANLANNLVDVTRYDYQDDVFRTATGTDNFINVRGGTAKTKYFVGASFMKNGGIVNNTDFQRVGLRANVDQILTSWMSLAVGANIIRSNSQELPSGNVFYSPINSINITNNIYDATLRDENGNLKAVEPTRVNPLSIVETFDINQNVTRSIANAKLSLYPIKGLQIDVIGGMDGFSQVGRQYIPIYPYSGVNIAYYANGYASTATNNSFQYNTDINVTYNTEIGSDISSNTALGYNYQNQRSDFLRSSGENLTAGFTSVNGSPTPTTGYGLSRLWIDGYYLQQTFGYRDQLFLTGAARVDNSSIFSSSQRNQLYTKAGLSWVVSGSEAYQNSGIANIINSAKLRASFGEAGGVAAIGPYDRFNLISSVQYRGASTLVPNSQLAFENLAPERTRELEFGADLSFLKNRLGLGFTYYSQNVFDLLVNKQISPSAGGVSTLDNVGEMSNKGIELSLNYDVIKTSNTSLNLFSIYSRNRNLITKLGSPTVTLNTVSGAPAFLIEGAPASVFYGTYFATDANGQLLLNSSGLPQTEKGTATQYKGEAIPAGSYVEGGTLYTPERGADGLPKGVALRKIIGDPNPDFTLSFGGNLKYKKMTFAFLLDGVYGVDVFNADRRTRQGVGIGDISEQELKGELPRGYIHAIYPVESWRIEDGSFTKIRELSLGYQLPNSLIKGMSDLTITVIGRNLYSFDSYDGYDPETNAGGVSDRLRGIDFGNLPIPRTIQFSLKGSF